MSSIGTGDSKQSASMLSLEPNRKAPVNDAPTSPGKRPSREEQIPADATKRGEANVGAIGTN